MVSFGIVRLFFMDFEQKAKRRCLAFVQMLLLDS